MRSFLIALLMAGASSAAELESSASVPEASTYALAGIGLLVLCVLLRRKLHLPPKG